MSEASKHLGVLEFRTTLREGHFSCLIIQFQRTVAATKVPRGRRKGSVADNDKKIYINTLPVAQCAIDFPLAPVNTKKLSIIYRALNNLCALADARTAAACLCWQNMSAAAASLSLHIYLKYPQNVEPQNDRKDRNICSNTQINSAATAAGVFILLNWHNEWGRFCSPFAAARAPCAVTQKYKGVILRPYSFVCRVYCRNSITTLEHQVN